MTIERSLDTYMYITQILINGMAGIGIWIAAYRCKKHYSGVLQSKDVADAKKAMWARIQIWTLIILGLLLFIYGNHVRWIVNTYYGTPPCYHVEYDVDCFFC